MSRRLSDASLTEERVLAGAKEVVLRVFGRSGGRCAELTGEYGLGVLTHLCRHCDPLFSAAREEAAQSSRGRLAPGPKNHILF